MEKADLLLELKQKILNDKSLPLRYGATQLVFGEGNADSEIYFLGEAPGYFEDKLGRPFVGNAGKLLDKLIEELGFRREEVYISNVVRFRPPANRDPELAEIDAFAPYVDEEIKIIDPKIIVTLGRFSMAKFLPGSKISQVHGKAFKITWQGSQRRLLPMYHPAAALRSTQLLEILRADFSQIKKVLTESADAGIEVGDQKGEGSQLNLF